MLQQSCPLIRLTEYGEPGCRQDRFIGPHGEDAWLLEPRDPKRLPCAEVVCADKVAMVLVKRADGTLGYVTAFSKGASDVRPFPRDLMARAAADPRFTLPARAFWVPPPSTVTRVIRDHFENFHPDDGQASALGSADTWGRVGTRASSTDDDPVLYVRVVPAGPDPQCGRSGLGRCVARQVYGADDPTTVYVGRWCSDYTCSFELVHVGSRNTVVVGSGLPLRGLDNERWTVRQVRRLIDLVLDPRLKAGGRR